MAIDMSLLEPITSENLSELTAGEWIWDNKPIKRKVHRRTLDDEYITEPIGFRIVHILDLKDYPKFSSKPFFLSTIDSPYCSSFEWKVFEKGRYFRFKRGE